ncbi:LLM class flavin-dependent oxidoreductase [Streptomyces sp. NPDC058291]|uniref:LLM class flavin-dependent oxidoreductase n=1 Tax=Streptomyces sp. NPDC058291 TaxID=3346427 RepID=UPI0036E3F683
MTSSPGRGLLHLAAAVDRPDEPGGHDAGPYVELARLAERGGLDFVTLDDGLAGPGFDAPAVLSRVAPATRRVGLVPTLAVPAEPFQARAAIAALDRVSRGRAGWRIDVCAQEETRLPGRPVGEPDERCQESGAVAEPAARARDGREDGAGTREVRGGRRADRDTLHHVDFGGAAFTAKGPFEGPGSPQGGPVRVADATEGHGRALAARHADVALVRAASPALARAARDRLRSEAAGAGRDPYSLRVMASLLIDLGDGEHAADPGHGGGGPRQTPQGPLYRGGPVDLADLIVSWRQEGAVDGFHLIPVEPRRDLERLVNGTVALLQHRGLFRTFYPGSTLREHLGLARPAKRIAGGAA